MKKKYIVLIILTAVCIAVSPACFKWAYLERGYRALGGEVFVPFYGVVLWHIWRDLKGLLCPYKIEEEQK